MISKTVLVLLLVCAVAVQDSHAWWYRLRRCKGAPGVCNGKGKRASEEGEALPDDVRKQLEENCPALLGLDEDGLNQDIVQRAVAESDVDGDGSLAGDEIVVFSQILEAIAVCQEFQDTLSVEGAQTDGGQP